MLFVADIATTQYITELALSGVVDNGHWYPPRGTPMYADFEKYRYFRTVRFIHRMLCFLDVWMFFVVAGSVDDWQWTVELTEECIWLVTVLSYGFVHCSPPIHLLVPWQRPFSCAHSIALRRRPNSRVHLQMPVASPAVVEVEAPVEAPPPRTSPVHNRTVQARTALVCSHHTRVHS